MYSRTLNNFSLHSPTIIGHRGAPCEAPENTLVSFRKASERGAKWVELDVQLSSDGIPIVIHDNTLDRTTDGSGLVGDHSLKALKNLDAGSWFSSSFIDTKIPTLEEALDLCLVLDLGLNIEIKPLFSEDTETAQKVLELVETRAHSLRKRLIFSSFEIASLETLRNTDSSWPRGYLINTLDSEWKFNVSRLGCFSIHPNANLLTKQVLISQMHELNVAVIPFTVNDTDEAKQLIEWRIDGLITDKPEDLSSVIR